ncbi:sulfurtransferase [Propionibacteriaceae bacterium G1746]|uniref:sulfurtransferase n=1 Tax=Aestuariimicrobium sp. G57 TaxID=3418485 RepID=UPI003C1F84D8
MNTNNSPLVSADELAGLLADDNPPRLLDASYQLGSPDFGAERYAAGHVPGAVFVDVEEVFSAHVAADGRGGRHPLPSPDELQAGLRAAGINDGDALVVYDQSNSMGAARGWWVLRAAGLEQVRVLDGGLAAWRQAGLPVTTDVPLVEPGTVRVVSLDHADRVDAAGVADALAQGRRVVDVRTQERFRGETEPIDPVAGHIPGSVNLPAGGLQRADGQFLAVDDLAGALDGLQPGDVVSCGSGITASNVILAAQAAGVTGLRLYAGSWSDWISDPSRPVATGE